MNPDTTAKLGDLTVFGFCQDGSSSIIRKMNASGLESQIIHFGSRGYFYLYTSNGETCETNESIALMLGFARTSDRTACSVDDMLVKGLISPQHIDHGRIRGNALVACFSKDEPQFSVYQTLLSIPQLYYYAENGNIICSGSLRCLVVLADQVLLNEDVVPSHFLFQLAPGTMTYFKNVYRLIPGHLFHWGDGGLRVTCVKDFRFSERYQQIGAVNNHTIDRVYESIKAVINTYLDNISDANQGVSNLLSGGVDSSIIQLVINERQMASTRAKTYSYSMHVPTFGFEVEYAREASELLGTNHMAADIRPDDFPDLLCQAIEVVAQPIPYDSEACIMGLGKFLASQEDAPRYFLVGQGADAVYGLGFARKLAIFDILSKIPGSKILLNVLAASIKPASARTAQGLLQVAKSLAARDDPSSFEHWTNLVCTYTNLDLARRSFGDQTVRKAFEYRRELEEKYLSSSDLSEQLHMIDLLTDGYEPAVLDNQIFLAHHKEMICPYLDEDVICVALSFDPKVRYIKRWFGFLRHLHDKHILKQILVKKSYASIARKRKGGSVFYYDLMEMMKSGPLQEMVRDIERPGFLSKPDFEVLLENPDNFLWNLLTFDIFQKRIFKS